MRRFRDPCRRTVLPLLLLALASCGRSAVVRSTPPPADPAAEITTLLEISAEGWNRGDLEAFLEPYLESPQTTFAGITGLTRGKQAVRERYQRVYWQNGAPESRLQFQDIEVRPLGPEHALAVGRYVLTSPAGGEPATGIFSLVLVRTPAGWRILHDHSS